MSNIDGIWISCFVGQFAFDLFQIVSGYRGQRTLLTRVVMNFVLCYRNNNNNRKALLLNHIIDDKSKWTKISRFKSYLNVEKLFVIALGLQVEIAQNGANNERPQLVHRLVPHQLDACFAARTLLIAVEMQHSNQIVLDLKRRRLRLLRRSATARTFHRTLRLILALLRVRLLQILEYRFRLVLLHKLLESVVFQLVLFHQQIL